MALFGKCKQHWPWTQTNLFVKTGATERDMLHRLSHLSGFQVLIYKPQVISIYIRGILKVKWGSVGKVPNTAHAEAAAQYVNFFYCVMWLLLQVKDSYL